MSRAEDSAYTERIAHLVSRLEGDELEVAELLLSRIDDGRPIYGAMHLDSDDRGDLQEALEEDIDGMVYRARRLIRLQRSESGTSVPQEPRPGCGGLSLYEVQHRLGEWADDHSPPMSRSEVIEMLVGEVGELAHASRYSRVQRGGGDPPFSSEADSIGDIVLCTARYCREAGLDLATCVAGALGDVEARHYTERTSAPQESPYDPATAEGTPEASGDQEAREGACETCSHLVVLGPVLSYCSLSIQTHQAEPETCGSWAPRSGGDER